MKTEPFWQAPKTLLRSARKASGARTTMGVNDWRSERWGSYEGLHRAVGQSSGKGWMETFVRMTRASVKKRSDVNAGIWHHTR
jgi:hypothetical protein